MSYAFRRVCLQLPASFGPKHGPLRQAFRPAGPGIVTRQIPVNRRAFGLSTRRQGDVDDAKAKKINQDDMTKEEEREKLERDEQIALRKQEERPWHRAGDETEQRELCKDPTNGDKTRGRLLTTPTRLLKLILPLPFHAEQARNIQSSKDKNDDDRDSIAPLALLVHPQQPLSYLERLLQAEIPPIDDGRRERIPKIYFRAEGDHKDEKQDKSGSQKKEGNVASYSGLGHKGPRKDRDETNWVRWSSSTEVGDFIRDAARGREFAIGIEGYEQELRVAVPSFNDRTYYMRVRLRRMSRRVEELAKLKQECDTLAHRGAHRMAQGGFGLLAGWWGVVYYVTFHTDAGWDLVEPVTYLAGLTTIMGGYLWFLYISKDLSYKAALNITVSKRQQALYQERGFDPSAWEALVHEANSLRREVRFVATEYDVDWDETKDLGGEEVMEVLDKEKKGRRRSDEDEDEDDAEEERAEHKRKEDKKKEKSDDGSENKSAS